MLESSDQGRINGSAWDCLLEGGKLNEGRVG